jgi:hypothetical protein
MCPVAFVPLAEEAAMDIARACKIIRQCNDGFSAGSSDVVTGGVADAVRFVKVYLENAKGDGKPMPELEIREALLLTPAGMSWVMPFVLNAESVETLRQRLGGR